MAWWPFLKETQIQKSQGFDLTGATDVKYECTSEALRSFNRISIKCTQKDASHSTAAQSRHTEIYVESVMISIWAFIGPYISHAQTKYRKYEKPTCLD